MTPFGTTIPSLLDNGRIANLIKYSNYCAPLPGYLCEMGVFSGGSLEILGKFNPGKDILAIDSFTGMPPITEGVDYHKEHDFNMVDFPAISGYFKMMYPHVRIVKGMIPKVLEYFDEHTRLAFTHIDLDLMQSISDALDFVFPRTLDGGIILLDDYKVRSTPGCEIALNNFFEARPDIKITFRGELKYWDSETAKSHNQYLIIK
jgi:O-methyltransferase